LDPNDENANTQRVLIYLLPLSIGWFALNVPSGLSLYYFANTAFTSAQQVCHQTLCKALHHFAKFSQIIQKS
jgi:membrane protein insertase Oxa1/YidC/SpoIIIJ